MSWENETLPGTSVTVGQALADVQAAANGVPEQPQEEHALAQTCAGLAANCQGHAATLSDPPLDEAAHKDYVKAAWDAVNAPGGPIWTAVEDSLDHAGMTGGDD